MIEIFYALGPIFLLILIGYWLRKKDHIAEGFWDPAEMLTYYVFFPALLLRTTSTADMGELDIGPMAFAIVSSMVLVGAITVKARPLLNIDGPTFTSLFQGSIRFNTYVGIAAASALWGQPGLTLIAIAVAFAVPLVNVLCIIVMETYGDHRTDGPPQVGSLVRSVLRNPLILACILGLSMNGMDVTLPPVFGPLVEILARAALPVGLLCVGAGLHFQTIREAGRTVIAANVIKLLVLPLVCWGCCVAIGVEGLTRDLCIFFCGLPVASSSYVLARKMGGNGEVMSAIITLTTLCAMVSLPLLLLFLEAL
ncbi:AEC family transporter [Terasakiella sp. SH-1]|uniref:AEC family transporter n=1 Tax=Terasakiella sp. SH-1 TaxID=2560057 RepID=UPI0010745BDB|nr:AEC family transporter [Terasakiella sp. SH-1]